MGWVAPVIAVFGGRHVGPEVETAAERVGRAVARRSSILLTGATGPGRGAVNRCATAGAEQVGRLPWVGVERDRAPSAPWHVGASLVLSPGYLHKRNYVEACLCDAGIALPGELGTASEVAFCFALGRPVVLLGEWEDRYPLRSQRAQALERLRLDAEERMRKDEMTPSPLDPLIDHALARFDLPDLDPTVGFRELPADDGAADDIVELALALLDRGDGRGSGPVTSPGWIARTEARIAPEGP